MSRRHVRITATVRVYRTNPTPAEARLDAAAQAEIQGALADDLADRAAKLEALLNTPGVSR